MSPMKFTELHEFKPKVNKKNSIECKKKLSKIIRYYITKFNIIFQMKT